MLAKRRTVVKRPQFWTSSVWDFWRDGVSQSFLRSFRSCREQTRLKFVEGLTARDVSSAIEWGSCMHWCLSQIYAEQKKPSKKRIVNLVDVYGKNWSTNVGLKSGRKLESQELVYGLSEVVLPVYVSRWAGDWNGEKYPVKNVTVRPDDWVDLESEFRVPYVFDDGAQTFLRGCFDGVFYDVKKRLWLFETKTKSRIDEDAISDTLSFDIQVMLYLYAIRILREKPVGVLYNVVRRPGQIYRKDDSMPDYLERVRQDVEDNKKWDHYFIRWEMSVTDAEIEVWAHTQLRPLMEDVRRWWEYGTGHYINDDALTNRYGRSDMYEVIVRRNRSGCFKRKTAFNELQELRDA